MTLVQGFLDVFNDFFFGARFGFHARLWITLRTRGILAASSRARGVLRAIKSTLAAVAVAGVGHLSIAKRAPAMVRAFVQMLRMSLILIHFLHVMLYLL